MTHRSRSPSSRLVVLIGASGSGKSTFARKALHADRGALVRLLPRPGRPTTRTTRPRPTTRSRCCTSSPPSGSRRGRLTVVDATNVQPRGAQAAGRAGARATTCCRSRSCSTCRSSSARSATATGPTATSARTSSATRRAQLRRSLRGLQREGFRHVHVLALAGGGRGGRRSSAQPLWNDRRDEHGPVRHHRRRPRLLRRAERAARRARLRASRRDGDRTAARIRAPRGPQGGLPRRPRRPRAEHRSTCCGW